MLIKKLHPWNVTPKEAIEIQKQLREMVTIESPLEHEAISSVAGCDASYSKSENRVYAIVAVVSYPQLQLIEESRAVCEVTFPYIPGLLVFREGPSLSKAFKELIKEPDVIMFDGHGVAHPRGIGIASHMGILLNKPTIGVAKTVLWGHYQEPDKKKGASSPLTRKGKEIGRVLRTRDNVKPVFISVGHKIDLSTAEKIVLGCCKNYRLPEPLRQTHLISNKLRIHK